MISIAVVSIVYKIYVFNKTCPCGSTKKTEKTSFPCVKLTVVHGKLFLNLICNNVIENVFTNLYLITYIYIYIHKHHQYFKTNWKKRKIHKEIMEQRRSGNSTTEIYYTVLII